MATIKLPCQCEGREHDHRKGEDGELLGCEQIATVTRMYGRQTIPLCQSCVDGNHMEKLG